MAWLAKKKKRKKETSSLPDTFGEHRKTVLEMCSTRGPQGRAPRAGGCEDSAQDSAAKQAHGDRSEEPDSIRPIPTPQPSGQRSWWAWAEAARDHRPPRRSSDSSGFNTGSSGLSSLWEVKPHTRLLRNNTKSLITKTANLKTCALHLTSPIMNKWHRGEVT